MRPIVTDRVACGVVYLSVCLSACRSVTVVSPTTTSEPIEMPFGLWAWVDSGNHALDGGPDPSWEGAIARAKRGSPL